MLATAVHHEMKVEERDHLDLSDTPPLSSPMDPVQLAAQLWLSRSLDEDDPIKPDGQDALYSTTIK